MKKSTQNPKIPNAFRFTFKSKITKNNLGKQIKSFLAEFFVTIFFTSQFVLFFYFLIKLIK